MAALAHALLGVPSRCGLCRAVNPKDNYKLCVWGFSRAIACYGISISSVSTRKKDGGNLTGSWALNATDALIVVHNATARTTVEIPVTCYQLIGVPEQAEKDVVVEAVIDLKSAKIDEGYTMDAIKSRKDLLMSVREKLIFEPEYAGSKKENIPPKSSLRIPWAWLPAALCLLQEGFFIILSWMPIYFNSVYHVDLRQAAWFSAVPWSVMAVMGYVGGLWSDILIRNGTSVTLTRRIMQNRCVLLGVSCGANIADYVARKAVEAGHLLDPIKVGAQVLMYPFFIGSTPTGSEIKLGNSYLFDKATCMLAWKLFLTEEEFDLDHPAGNPLMPAGIGPPLKTMPPTLTVVAEHDWMCDRGIAYSEELRKANVDAPLLNQVRIWCT